MNSFKKFCNDLRCVLCGSQLDGAVYKNKARLYCVSNNKEYKAEFSEDYSFPINETVSHIFTHFEYEFHVKFIDGLFYSCLYKKDLSLNEIYQEKDKVLLLKCNSKLDWFRQRLSEEEFNKKIKIYSLFS